MNIEKGMLLEEFIGTLENEYNIVLIDLWNNEELDSVDAEYMYCISEEYMYWHVIEVKEHGDTLTIIIEE